MSMLQMLLGASATADAPTNLAASLTAATAVSVTYQNTTANVNYGFNYSTTNTAAAIRAGTSVTGNATTATKSGLTAETTYYILAWADAGGGKTYSDTIVSFTTYPTGTTILSAGTSNTTVSATLDTWGYYAVPKDKVCSFYAVGGSGGSGGAWNYTDSSGGNGGSVAASFTFSADTLIRGCYGGKGKYGDDAGTDYAGVYAEASSGAGASAWQYKNSSGTWIDIIVAGGGGGGTSAWNGVPISGGNGGIITSNESSATTLVTADGGDVASGGTTWSEGGTGTGPGEEYSYDEMDGIASDGGRGGYDVRKTGWDAAVAGEANNSPRGAGGKFMQEYYGNGGGGAGGYYGGSGGRYPNGGGGGSSMKMNGATPIAQVLSATTGHTNEGGSGTAGQDGTDGAARIDVAS